jgi:hypothetical protein
MADLPLPAVAGGVVMLLAGVGVGVVLAKRGGRRAGPEGFPPRADPIVPHPDEDVPPPPPAQQPQGRRVRF